VSGSSHRICIRLCH